MGVNNGLLRCNYRGRILRLEEVCDGARLPPSPCGIGPILCGGSLGPFPAYTYDNNGVQKPTIGQTSKHTETLFADSRWAGGVLPCGLALLRWAGPAAFLFPV